MAVQNRKVLSQLVRIAYDKDTVTGWRAIKAIGAAARALIAIDYPFLREMVRKLLWSLSDESGGIGWSAPEILGEIVSSDTERFQDIIPLIAEVYSIEEKVFRPGVLYALNRIGQENPALLIPYKGIMFEGLQDKDALVRVHAIELLQKLLPTLSAQDAGSAKEILGQMAADRAEVWIYNDAGFENIQVRERAIKALAELSSS